MVSFPQGHQTVAEAADWPANALLPWLWPQPRGENAMSQLPSKERAPPLPPLPASPHNTWISGRGTQGVSGSPLLLKYDSY